MSRIIMLMLVLAVVPGTLLGGGPASKVTGEFIRVEIPVIPELNLYACEFSVHAATDGRDQKGSVYCSRLTGDQPHSWEMRIDDMDCVFIDGNFARIGGLVDAVDGSGLLGWYMLMEMRDYGNGKPLPDMLYNSAMPSSRSEVFEKWCNGDYNEFGDTTQTDPDNDFPYGYSQFLVVNGNLNVLDSED